MNTQESAVVESTVSDTKASKRGRGRVATAIAAGVAVLAVGTAWAGNDVANKLCHPVADAAAIGGHPHAPEWCDGYDSFKEEVASRVEAAIDAATPDIQIVHDPVFDPMGEHPIG